jgi:DNA gyrase/topoisomerase IV subunit A
MANKTTVDQFMQSDYVDYAKYSIFERAIPSLTDGFKPTARKIMHIALKHAKKKSMKVAALGGYVMAEGKYQHGDTSLLGGITAMAQKFNQSLPYLNDEGQYGSVYSPFAGAPRYLETSIANTFDLLFKDNDILNYQQVEGAQVEPKTYYPIIPTVLLNAQEGIAVGYRTKITNRNPHEILDAVQYYLKHNELDTNITFEPYVNGLIGHWRTFNDRYEHHGNMEVSNDTTVYVTGLAYGNTFESYEQHLNYLINVQVIKEWHSETDEHNAIKYKIVFSKESLAWQLKHDALYKTLKMWSIVSKDTLTLIDIDGSIRTFDSVAQIIKIFVDWRLTIYNQRKINLIAKLTDDKNKQLDIIKFITLITDNIIVLHKLNKKVLTKILREHDLHADLINISIYNLTLSGITDAEHKLATINEQLEYATNTTAKQMYTAELAELESKLPELMATHYTLDTDV